MRKATFSDAIDFLIMIWVIFLAVYTSFLAFIANLDTTTDIIFNNGWYGLIWFCIWPLIIILVAIKIKDTMNNLKMIYFETELGGNKNAKGRT